jgi:transposase-like protein
MAHSTVQDAAAPRELQRPAIAGRTVRRGRMRYSKGLAAKICRRLASGASLSTIARDPEMPPRSTLRYWIKQDQDGLFARCPRTEKKRDPRTLYTKELAEEICRRLASGRSMNSIAADPDMPAACTVFNWARKDVDGFAAAYASARAIGAEALADQILDIADDRTNGWQKIPGEGLHFNRENIERAKLRIAARQWLFTVARPNHERGSVREALKVEIVRFGDSPEAG